MRLEFGYKMVPLKTLLLASLFLSLPAIAQTINLSSGAKVEFDAVGKPSMINIKGTGAKAKGILTIKDSNVIGEFILNLKEFTTDMDMRDEHMKEKYLEVGKPGFDKAILKIDQIIDIATLPLDGSWSPQNLKGILTLHGVSKEIPLNFKLNIKDAKAKGDVKFKIKLKDFNIEIPSFAGITVADEVTALVNIDHKVDP